MPEVGIVIRTFNEEALLGRTLEQIRAQQGPEAEVLIVDSGSTDGTLDIAHACGFARIVLIPQAEFSYGRALNVGIAELSADVDHVVMLSAHAVPCDDTWLRELLLPFRQNGRVVGVYGKQVPMPEHLSNPVVRALAVSAYPYCYGEQSFVTGTDYFFSNANAAITRQSWSRCKFDEEFPNSEDWLWAARQLEDGRQIAYQASATVYHSHPDTYKEYFRRRCNEIRGGREVDPGRFGRTGPIRLCASLGLLFSKYCGRALQRLSLTGEHYDLMRLRCVGALALYATRRSAAGAETPSGR